MNMQILATRVLLCVLLATSAPVFAQFADIGQVGQFKTTTPDYDSDAGRPPVHTFSGPETSGRPGEVFFREGAHAFMNKDYSFALEMYKVAASWAFKPAEYNLGVMYAKGQGVKVDLPRALAWMALAAERGDNTYVRAREVVYASMTNDQFAEANQIWRDLKTTYGDAVALQRAKTRWKEVLRSATGSHVGFVGDLAVGSKSGAGSGQFIGSSNGNAPPPSDGHGGGTPATVAISASQVTGGNQMDGSLAYRQLQQSDNPYDPKFEQRIGTATVGPLITANPEKKGDEDAHSDKPAAEEHDHRSPDR
ncbi:MAG: sel1 repeat family protein [Rhodanobacteraceae bacterium]